MKKIIFIAFFSLVSVFCVAATTVNATTPAKKSTVTARISGVDENIDFDTKMRTLQGELKELLAAEEKSKADLLAVFKELGYEIKL